MIRSKLTFVAGVGAGSLMTALVLTMGSAGVEAWRADGQAAAGPPGAHN